MPGKLEVHIAFFLSLSFSSAIAQLEPYRDDSSFQKKLHQIVNKRWSSLEAKIDPDWKSKTLALQTTGQSLVQKYEFLLGIMDASYFGGGKSGKKLQNLTLTPFLSQKQLASLLLDSADTKSLDQSTFYLHKINSQFDQLYLTNFINRNKEQTVTGDDDQTVKVEVTVKVLESFAGKKEMPGYSVYSENPFVKNSREDFSPTTKAIKKISPGWRDFYIQKGHVRQKKYWHVTLGDENTYTVFFAETK